MTLPAGNLTFLFTDLENSTPLWENFPESVRTATARHDVLMRTVIERHHGRVVKTTGDGFHAVFETPSDGGAAALAIRDAVAIHRRMRRRSLSRCWGWGLWWGQLYNPS